MTSLQDFEIWLAICEAKARYCRSLDTKDWQQFTDLFTDDFELDVSEGTDVPVITGRDAAVAEIRSSIDTAITVHQVHSPEMTRDGEAVKVVWAMQDRVIWGPEQASIVGYGHYHERWVKCGNHWKIAALRLTRLHVDVLDAPAAGAG